MYERNAVIVILVPFLLAVGILHESGGAASESLQVRRVEDFSCFKDGSFPDGWKSRGGDGSAVYRVRSNQETFLEAKAVNTAVAIAKKFSYDLNEYSHLKWQWRVLELPKGGDERFKETGDSAASIYVIFEGFLRPNTIKYVWSASLPLGTTTESPYSSKTKIIVLRNQHSPMGEWVTETADVYADYKRLFKGEPEQVQAIGLMSDSDNTGSVAIAHYRQIAVCTHK
jgi:hypothetical protein